MYVCVSNYFRFIPFSFTRLTNSFLLLKACPATIHFFSVLSFSRVTSQAPLEKNCQNKTQNCTDTFTRTNIFVNSISFWQIFIASAGSRASRLHLRFVLPYFSFVYQTHCSPALLAMPSATIYAFFFHDRLCFPYAFSIFCFVFYVGDIISFVL